MQYFSPMKSLIIGVHLFISVCSLAQTGYKIDFKIKGLKDTTAYLGYYTLETTYIKDTARINSQGIGTFEGKQSLAQGFYILVLGKTKILDFVVSNQQHFSFETSTDEYIQNMKVKGDDDNRLLFENLIFISERHKEATPFLKILQDSTLNEDQKKASREAFAKVNDKVMKYQDEIILKYPTTLTARFLKADKPIQIPDPPKLADGSIDSTFQLRYYRAHYFDNFDLADDALLRLPKPYYTTKVNDYLD